jgi:hypothetical protein
MLPVLYSFLLYSSAEIFLVTMQRGCLNNNITTTKKIIGEQRRVVDGGSLLFVSHGSFICL